MITKTSDHIVVEGHIGTWYVIDEGLFNLDCNEDEVETKRLFLLEHETHGDEAACVVIDEDGKLIEEDIWNGFDDLADMGYEQLKDE